MLSKCYHCVTVRNENLWQRRDVPLLSMYIDGILQCVTWMKINMPSYPETNRGRFFKDYCRVNGEDRIQKTKVGH
jgi:hypothetical protein